MYVLRVYADRVFTEAYGLVMRDAIPKFIDIIQFAKDISVVKFMMFFYNKQIFARFLFQ